MQMIKSKNTKPEILLRKELWKRGLRYRLHGKNIIGKPDIYIKGKKIAIFVDSDFWHGRLYKEGRSVPKTNKDYWIHKLERNIHRDTEVNRRLLKEGWTVIRCWESSLKKDIDDCVTKIYEVIEKHDNNLTII